MARGRGVQVQITGDAARLFAELRRVESALQRTQTRIQAINAQLGRPIPTAPLEGWRGALARLQARLAVASAKLREFGASARAVGRRLTMSLTLPIVGAGVAALRSASSFDTAMTKIGALVGASEGQVRRWGEQILSLAGRVGKPPQELAEALYFVLSAGIDASKALDVVRVSAQAAAAGLGDTATVADTVTSALNAYRQSGLTAAQATDALTAAVREGKAEPEELAASLGDVIPTASAVGVSFQELLGVLSGLTLSGLSASRSAVSLNQVMTTLLKPSAQARKALAEVGLSIDDVRRSLRERGLLATLSTLDQAFGGNAAAMAKVFGNVRALRGALAAVGQNYEMVEGVTWRVIGSTGDLDKAFQRTSRSGAFKQRQAMESLRASMIRVGQVILPVVATIGRHLARLADAFGRLPKGAQTAIVVVAALAAAAGPLVWTIGAISTALGLLLTPVGLVVAALVGLGVGFVLLYRRSEGFRNAVNRARDVILGLARTVAEWAPKIWGALQTAWERARGVISGAAAKIRMAWSTVSGAVQRAWSAVAQALGAARRTLAPVVSAVREVVDALGGLVAALIDVGRRGAGPIGLIIGAVRRMVGGVVTAVRVLVTAWRAQWAVISTVVRAAWAVIRPIVTAGIRVIGAVIRAGMQVVVAVVRAAWTTVRTVITTALRVIAAIIRAVTAVIRGDWSAVWAEIRRIVSVVWAAIQTIINAALGVVRAVITATLNVIRSVWQSAWDAMRGVVSAVWGAITGAVRSGVETIRSVVGAIPGVISGVIGAAANAAAGVGRAIVDGVWRGLTSIGDLATRIFEWLRDQITRAIGWVRDRVRLPFGLKIPGLAAGGIVTRPTIAMLGEAGPEAVIPLRRAGGVAVAAPAPITVHSTVHVHGPVWDREELERILRRRDEELARRLRMAGAV